MQSCNRSTVSAVSIVSISLAGLAILSGACGDPGGTQNEGELITTVIATFTPEGGGTAITALFNDPDGDGGEPPVVDAIELAAGSYDLVLRLENRFEEPAEDITVEVADEAAEHQLFFTGTAVDGPASDQPGAPLMHAYADSDENGLPIGLASTVVAVAGTGEMIVTLRHLPPVNGAPVKVEDLAAEVRTGGFAAIGGTTDVQVSFPLTVQ